MASDHAISRATGHRYVDEIVEVLAKQAPESAAVLERAREEGLRVILDGTVIAANGYKEQIISVWDEPIDLWYSDSRQGTLMEAFTLHRQMVRSRAALVLTHSEHGYNT